MNYSLSIARRAQLRTASQPTVKGQLPQWVIDRLPALPAPAEPPNHDPVTWRLALRLLRHPDYPRLPDRRPKRRGPYGFRCTHGSGDARQSAGFWSKKPMRIPFFFGAMKMPFEPQSVNAISKLCGIPHARVTECLLGVPEAGRKAGHPTYALETALPAIVASLATPNDPAAMSPRSRRDHFAAERAQLALAREKGEVLPVRAFEVGVAHAFARCNNAIQSIPDNCERKTGVTPEAVLMIQQAIDAALDSLADELQSAYHAAKKCTSDELAATGRRLIEEANIADLL